MTPTNELCVDEYSNDRRGEASSDRRGSRERILRTGQIHRFDDGAFEGVLSRSGAMFFGDQVTAFSPPSPAARPGSMPVTRDSAEGDDHDPVRRHP